MNKELSGNCENCRGCKHIHYTSSGFCYMFENRPEILPCAQHDKYAEQRKKYTPGVESIYNMLKVHPDDR